MFAEIVLNKTFFEQLRSFGAVLKVLMPPFVSCFDANFGGLKIYGKHCYQGWLSSKG